MNEQELMHFGVKGMKWGVRRNRRIGVIGRTTVKGVAKLHQGISNMQKKSASKIKKDADSIREQKNQMLSLKARNGKSLFTEKDLNNMIKSLDNSYKKAEQKARKHEKFANQLLSELSQLKIRDLR